MKARYRFTAFAGMLMLLFMLLPGMSAVAAKKAAAADAPGTVATTWVFWPKAGEEKAFEQAIKTHAAWRKQAAEGFEWAVFQPIVGSDLSFYVIRSGSHQWKDFDANQAWEEKSNAGEAFEKQMGKLVARSEHYFSDTDTKQSHWIDSKDYKFFSVTSYFLKPGTAGERRDAISKITKAVVDEKWAYPYSISHVIGGKEPMQVVSPTKDYAGMADAEPSLMKVLSKSLGSDTAAAETMKQFGSSIDHMDTTIYRYRPDLSTPK